MLGILIIGLSSFSVHAQDNKLKESIILGKKLYEGRCAGCHRADGAGYVKQKLVPPLAKSDYVLANKENGIKAIIFGISGKVMVNGIEYNQNMPRIDWKDQDVANVLNYIRNNWDNKGEFISPEDVKSVRKTKK